MKNPVGLAHRSPFTVRRSHITVLFMLLLCLVSACRKDEACKLRHGEGGVIDMSLPEFYDLSHVGGYMRINRGYRGIYIYRNTLTEFVACDCACPSGDDGVLAPAQEYGGLVLRCPSCGATFSVLDGMPLEGSTTSCPLYQYDTHLENGMLSVY